jgi:signal peptidase II
MTMADDEKQEEAKVAAPSGGFISRLEAKWKIFWIVSILSLIADQATKIWARAVLPVAGHGTLPGGLCDVPADIASRRCGGVAVDFITGFWEWRLSMNPGSAFGLFGGQSFARVFLSVVGIAAVIGMGWMLKKSRTDQRVLHWALAFVAGGAVGNLIDRIYYGVVTDMVLWRYKTHEWPVFNVADIVLVIGVGLMFIDIQKEGKREKAAKKAKLEKAKSAGLVKH